MVTHRDTSYRPTSIWGRRGAGADWRWRGYREHLADIGYDLGDGSPPRDEPAEADPVPDEATDSSGPGSASVTVQSPVD